MPSESILALVDSMPFRYGGLVIESTNRCNARCGICYQSSGPKGSELYGRADLPRNVLLRCIEEAIALPNLEPRFHLAGGEAFIRLEQCIELFAHARSVGFLDITATTNAFWARKKERARAIAAELRDAGVTSLEISWDRWHAEWVSPEAISNCLAACRDEDIETNLRILTTRTERIEAALDLLDSATVTAAHRITTGPVFATGRAALTINPEDFYSSTQGCFASCHATLNLSINSRGDVAPCCAGFDQSPYYRLGNVNDESIVTIAERMESDPIMRTLVFRGVSAFLPILEKRGVHLGSIEKGDFRSMCHLCWIIFNSRPAVEAIRGHRQDATVRALTRLVEAMEGAQ